MTKHILPTQLDFEPQTDMSPAINKMPRATAAHVYAKTEYILRQKPHILIKIVEEKINLTINN